MGKVIEKLSEERNHEIVSVFNSSNPINELELKKADIAIEFSRPELAPFHIRFCVKNDIPIVVGTTAWNDSLDELKKFVLDHNGSMLFSSNFSIGVNMFFEINKKLAVLMSQNSNYSLRVKEIHHTQKLDSPSGTAVSLANDIISNNKHYTSWHLTQENFASKEKESIPVEAERTPNTPGTHIVNYSSFIDSIELKHIAHNREGFALGSIIAAEFLVSKKGLFTMSDVLNL